MVGTPAGKHSLARPVADRGLVDAADDRSSLQPPCSREHSRRRRQRRPRRSASSRRGRGTRCARPELSDGSRSSSDRCARAAIPRRGGGLPRRLLRREPPQAQWPRNVRRHLQLHAITSSKHRRGPGADSHRTFSNVGSWSLWTRRRQRLAPYPGVNKPGPASSRPGRRSSSPCHSIDLEPLMQPVELIVQLHEVRPERLESSELGIVAAARKEMVAQLVPDQILQQRIRNLSLRRLKAEIDADLRSAPPTPRHLGCPVVPGGTHGQPDPRDSREILVLQQK